MELAFLVFLLLCYFIYLSCQVPGLLQSGSQGLLGCKKVHKDL